MKRYFLIICGMVQGVGCRHFAMTLALQNNLTGSARNMENGDVQIYIQGLQDNCDVFIQQLLKGNRFIRIIDYSIKECPLIENEKGFKALY